MGIMPEQINMIMMMENLQYVDKRLLQILNEVKEDRKICSQSKSYKTSRTGQKHITLKRGIKNVSRRTSLVALSQALLKGPSKVKILEKINSKDTNSQMLLDSFMYRDYFIRENDRTNVALHPLIATSRNPDEFVAKKLSSGTRQSTNHPSEEASRSRSNESLSLSEGPHSMNLELVRLATFSNFPPSRSVSVLKLAQEGFYYIGQGEDDLVICFACKSQKKGWRDGDIPREIHQQMSPQCPLLNEQSVNVPKGGSLKSHSGNPRHSNTEQVSETSEIERNIQHTNSEQVGGSLNSHNGNHQHSNAEQVSETSGIERNIQHSNSEQVGGSLNSQHGNCWHPKTKQVNKTSEMTRNHQNANSEQVNENPLGINFDCAKYPAYAVLATRVSSFQDWPTSLTQTPQVLAMAGFFYAGYRDYTRCFFCGGGLRNWEPGDDPWTEHARRFPKCTFVRQNKGDECVALVQKRHQELEPLEAIGEGVTSTSSDEQNSLVERNVGLSSGLRQSEISAFPSFQGVLEIGYPASEIREAYNLLRGTKDPEDITEMDLMEVILSKDDRNNGLDISSSINRRTPNNEDQSVEQNRGLSEIIQNFEHLNSEQTNSSFESLGNHQLANSEHINRINENTIRSRTIQNLVHKYKSYPQFDIGHAKYERFNTIETRETSFQSFSTSASTLFTELAPKLVRAGFFYVGEMDYTRCFFCGLQLLNWVAGDDPWTEHARWSPKCAFLRQNKGDEFVAMVQIEHLELLQEASGTSNEHQTRDQAAGSKNITSQRSSEPDVSSLPAFQSVLEMGYSSNVIKQAFELLQNTKDVTALMEENRQLKTRMMCKICMDEDATIAMVPCGHLCCCTDCASVVTKCPICRQFVEKRLKIWIN